MFICIHLWLISDAAAASIRLPEGIADEKGRTGFFASATGGIECIDLAHGKVLWQTHEAQRPLLLDGHHLIAQAGTKRNRLRILRLDVKRNGECDFESDPIVFPAWVVTGEAHGHSFVANWHLAKHHLVLEWEASAWYAGGSQATPEEELAARKHASGTAHIELRTGQIEILPAQKKQLPPPPMLPEHLEKKALRWQGLVGQYSKVLALEEENGQQRFVLHTWDRQSEKEQQPKELLRGKRLQVRTTLDERVLCLHESTPGPDEHGSLMPKKKPSFWHLYSVQTGEPLGRIPDEAGMHAIVVLGKRVFYLVPGTLRGPLDQPNEQPQILKAIDLSTGKKLWEHPVAGKLIAPPL
ncbi:MAG TPA: hypothetical protein VE999_05180 [Gemmataceae bacterium]|nr:hypothetical protein [Gemmataceae bacterium]